MAPERLTATRESERDVQYLHDGKGYTCRSGEALCRVRFGSHLIEQIDPKLPSGETLSSYSASPDGKCLAIVARKRKAASEPGRRVKIANYRDRFMKVPRSSTPGFG